MSQSPNKPEMILSITDWITEVLGGPSRILPSLKRMSYEDIKTLHEATQKCPTHYSGRLAELADAHA